MDADPYLADDEEEAVDGEPVLDDDGPAASSLSAASGALAPLATDRFGLVPAASPAVQAVAAAATGFVAGAATLAIARRRSTRKLTRSSARRRGSDALPIIGTRSFLIDVHMLRPS